MPKKKKIAIIFLDEIHHINHFASIATELAKTNEVQIITYPDSHEYLKNTLQRLGGNVQVKQLKTKAFRALTDKLKGRSTPRKGFWIKKHRNYILTNFDAIIFSDFFHRYFVEGRGDKLNPKFIKITHGTPGRGYSFKKQQLDFDFQLIPGPNFYNALKSRNLLLENHAMVGYPKIDAVPDASNRNFFDSKKPVVVYNPHFGTPSSSWHTMGVEILEYFYNQNTYNLIFAPHINLFNKTGGEDPKTVPQKYKNCPHIHIDLGSQESVDMTYINIADIYLGELSSQVYEFIIKPRPCIFINVQNVDYKNDPMYRFWKCGSVIETTSELDRALKITSESFGDFEMIQKKITAENYYTEEGSTASERAASAISEYLQSN